MTVQWSPLPEWEVFGWSIGQKYRLGGSSWNISEQISEETGFAVFMFTKSYSKFRNARKATYQHMSVF